MNNREIFNRLITEQKAEVMAMGSLVEKALARSIEALKKRDLKLAHQIIADDQMINQKRFQIEKNVVNIIAEQQPNANELNVPVAILSIIIELERIGDYAAGNAKIVVMMGDQPLLKPLIDIPRMNEITIQMIHDSLVCFSENNAEGAAKIVSMDEVVDGIYDQIFRELLTFMMTDPKTINRATHLIWVSHNIERAADRATNICERIVFMVTGKMEEIGSSKY